MFFDPCRQTGRTTRMLREVIAAAETSASPGITVVCANEDNARYIQRMMLHMVRSRDVKAVKAGRVVYRNTPITFVSATRELRGERGRLFVDHYTYTVNRWRPQCQRPSSV
jgi:hypothetical protein